MKYLLALITLLTAFCFPKGTVAQSINLGGTTTRAVVVGISDYQDPLIPDLRFADRDAEAFANFLRSPAGGSLDGDHLKLLVNKEATVAQFAIALDWLIENSKEGDQAIIYFSGHGDVEKKTLTQPGFLLCWDAPARVYMAGGAFNLRDIQEIVSTLSIQNKSKVVVITDACRSGTLAGNSVGGAQATAANLAKQYANEIKILSCQPNEYSIEGEQWGGGRGAFSFNLVEALYGMADANKDLSVTLQEVGRYLEDHVTPEVAPVSQIPKVVGNPTERLATVDANLLAAISSGRTNQMQLLSPIDTRGLEDDVLASVDTTIRELYRLFNKALKSKVFLEPATACADAYYERLIAEPKLARLHSTMRRNYAAALQDDAQQVMNKLLKSDLKEYSLSQTATTEKNRHYPRYLERAAELLGPQHYMYPVLQARKHFFQGDLLLLSKYSRDEVLGEKAMEEFREALLWQPDMPQAYGSISWNFFFHFNQLDSAEYYVHRATALAPAWVIPYTDLAFLVSQDGKQFDRAKQLIDEALLIDSNSTLALFSLGTYYYFQNKGIEAEATFKKVLEIDSTNTWAHAFLGNVLGYNQKRYDDAIRQYQIAIQLDSTNAWFYGNLGNMYFLTDKFADAEHLYKKGIQVDSTIAFIYNRLSTIYIKSSRYAEAEQLNKRLIPSVPNLAYYNIACCQSLQNRTGEAFESLEQALNLGYRSYDWMQQDPDFAPLRKQKERWGNLMKNAIVLDTISAKNWNNLGLVYFRAQFYTDAEPVFKKAMSLDSINAETFNNLGLVYSSTRRYDEAEEQYQKAIQLDSTFSDAYYNFACLKSLQNQVDKAFETLELAINHGYKDYNWMHNDTDLAPLRAQKERWTALMKKYFPDQVKD